MVNEVVFVFVLIALIVFSVGLLFVPYNIRTEWGFRRLSLKIFGSHVSRKTKNSKDKMRILQKAHYGVTLKEYQSKTLLYASMYGAIGSILGLYFSGFIVNILASSESLLSIFPQQLSFLFLLTEVESIGIIDIFILFIFGTFTFGIFTGYGVYIIRWWLPHRVANYRRKEINETLPQLIAFSYALSRSGTEFSDIMKTIAQTKSSYGEAAKEFEIGVTQTEVYGNDIVSALREMGVRTPSTQFSEFSNNLASVLESGQDLSSFLAAQYKRYQQQEEQNQQQFIQLIATLAESYVSVLVVGPLLLYTILVVIGLFGIGETLLILQILIYIAVPAITISFALFMKSITETYDEVESIDDRIPTVSESINGIRKTNNVETNNQTEKLTIYKKYVQKIKFTIRNPLHSVRSNPKIVLYITTPIVGLFTIVRIVQTYLANGEMKLVFIDDIIIQSALILIGTLAIAYQYHSRYINSIRNAIPDFLDRFASVNEAGMSLISGFKRVTKSDLNELNEEMERVKVDVENGSQITIALQRMEKRIKTPIVTRTVTLITNAMNASGKIAPVLRIAATQSQDARRLRRKRSDELKTYLVIIYLSCFVFLIIITALTQILIPSIPIESLSAVETNSLGFSFESAEINAFTLILFHASIIQGTIAGFIAGLMAEGDIKAGSKHAFIILIISYIVLLLLY